MANKKSSIPVHRPKTQSEFRKLNNDLMKRGFVALDALKPGAVKSLTIGETDPSLGKADDLAAVIGCGTWSNGPLAKVAWSFDERDNTVVAVNGPDKKPLGLGYVKWGPGDNTPSVIPPLAQALPYTAAPLRYIADLTAGLGPKLMYRTGTVTVKDEVYVKCIDFEFAGMLLKKRIRDLQDEKNSHPDAENYDLMLNGEILKHDDYEEEDELPDDLKEAKAAYKSWKQTWYGYEELDNANEEDEGKQTYTHIPGAKEFLEDNNLNLHLTQCEQDDVMLDMYFPTVGFQRGRRGAWNPKIVQVDMLPAHSCRLERMNENRHINHVYFSDEWRTRGAGTKTVTNGDETTHKKVMYPAAMPQHLLSDLRYIVESNQRTRIKNRPTWVVCPTYYPSGQKPYYPQPAWWSIFTSKAFDFSSTILYDKAKQRENKTSWGKIFYISLDYLDQVFADEGYQGKPDEQKKFIDDLEKSMEDFLQHRENHGKMMRQWMWQGQDGKDHHNVEIVDVAETTNDAAKAGKEELELSTSPIFLALQVDPRLVGVPMVQASNGGTALREMHLLKQQQLNVKQRLYLQFLNIVPKFNRWDEHAEFVIMQQTFTTLDNSKTGTVETVAGEGA